LRGMVTKTNCEDLEERKPAFRSRKEKNRLVVWVSARGKRVLLTSMPGGEWR